MLLIQLIVTITLAVAPMLAILHFQRVDGKLFSAH